jgi:hypothetical protein
MKRKGREQRIVRGRERRRREERGKWDGEEEERDDARDGEMVREREVKEEGEMWLGRGE